MKALPPTIPGALAQKPYEARLCASAGDEARQRCPDFLLRATRQEILDKAVGLKV